MRKKRKISSKYASNVNNRLRMQTKRARRPSKTSRLPKKTPKKPKVKAKKKHS